MGLFLACGESDRSIRRFLLSEVSYRGDIYVRTAGQFWLRRGNGPSLSFNSRTRTPFALPGERGIFLAQLETRRTQRPLSRGSKTASILFSAFSALQMYRNVFFLQHFMPPAREG